MYLYQHKEIYNSLSVNYVYYIYTVGWDVGPTYNLSRPNLPAYIHTDMLKHDLWRIRQIHKTSKTRGIGSSPFQDTASKNRQRPIWLSLISWLWCFILRTITINSLPQITQHRHCIGSALDIVSSATNWNESVPDAITVQLQLNPTPELANGQWP